MQLTFLILVLRTVAGLVHRRSTHQKQYNGPNDEPNYRSEFDITSQTKGIKHLETPMYLGEGTVWSFNLPNFTYYHLSLIEEVVAQRAKTHWLKIDSFIEKYYFWQGAETITQDYHCYSHQICTINLKYSPELSWQPKFSFDWLPEPYDSFYYTSSDPSFKILDLYTFNHTFFGPCKRSIWFNRVTFNYVTESESTSSWKFWQPKTLSRHRAGISILNKPDGILGYKSTILPLDQPIYDDTDPFNRAILSSVL